MSIAHETFDANASLVLPIRRPVHFMSTTMPEDDKARGVAEDWATMALDCSNWADRAAAMLGRYEVIRDLANPVIERGELQQSELAAAYVDLITSAVEHLAEPSMYCLEQAAFYTLTRHYEWSVTGVLWLWPIRSTFFREWVEERPLWQQLASEIRLVSPVLPYWIETGAEE